MVRVKGRKGIMVERDKDKNELVINYVTLRNLIGLIVLLFPFVVFLGNWAFFTHRAVACLFPSSNYLPDSLSGYYYTHMRSIFVGGLWAIGVFLVAYNGYNLLDRLVTITAGLSAIVLACFPTNPPQYTTNKCGPVTPVRYASSLHQTTIGHVHLGAMVTLFVMVAIMALLFAKTEIKSVKVGQAAEHAQGTATGDESGRNASQATKAGGSTGGAKGKDPKSTRNAIYRICASLIAASGIVALFVPKIWQHNVTPWLLYCETFAFLVFGFSWAVKGQAILFGRLKRLKS